MSQETSKVFKNNKTLFKEKITNELKNTGTQIGSEKPMIKSQSLRVSSVPISPAKEEQQKWSENTKHELIGKILEYVSTSNVDHPIKYNLMQESLEITNQGLQISSKDKNLLLTRSYIQFYCHDFYSALCDIDSVINIERASSGEEEPNSKDLLHKGRCHACLSMFKEAIADFNKVIELDDEHFDAYLYRGKCSYLVGDTSKAFLDFQKLILLKPKNPMVHAYAGNLLMTTGSYEDAAKAFTNAHCVYPCSFAVYQRARCLLAIGDIKNAIKDLRQASIMYEQQTPIKNNLNMRQSERQNAIVYRDKECLENILESINILNQLESKRFQKDKSVFHSQEVCQQDSQNSSEFQNSFHDKAIDEDILNSPINTQILQILNNIIQKFDQLLDLEKIEIRDIQSAAPPNKHILEPEDFEQITQDSRMQQQIIPNVARIKIEKLRALRRNQAKQERISMNRLRKKKSNDNLLIFNLEDDDVDQQMKTAGLKICPWSYYMENLFSKDDLYLYRGILKFYGGQYAEAIQDLKQSYQTKQLYKLLDNETDLQKTNAFNFDDLVEQSENDKESLNYQNMNATDIQAQESAGRISEFNPQEQFDLSIESSNSEQTDLSDIGLCSLNTCEMQYNIVLCLLKLHRYKKAREVIDKILQICPKKYEKDLRILDKIIKQWGKEPSSQKYQKICIEPFPASPRLCTFYPCVKFKRLLSQHTNNKNETHYQEFIARPSFSFPFVKPPNMIPNVDEAILLNEFCDENDINNLPQPQALWIKTHELLAKNKLKYNKSEKDLSSEQKRNNQEIRKEKGHQHFQFTETIINYSESYISESQNTSQVGSSQISGFLQDIKSQKSINTYRDIGLCNDILISGPR